MTWRQLSKQWFFLAIAVCALDRLIGILVLPLYLPERAAVWRSGTARVENAYGHLRSATLARADVLILGSSRAQSNYDDQLLSKELHRRVYNAGSPGLGVLQARATLAMARRLRPVACVVLDAVFVPNEERMIRRLEPWLGVSPVVDQMLQSDWREELKTRSYAYRCGGSLFELAEDYGKAGATWGYLPKDGQMERTLDVSANLPSQLPPWFERHLEGLAQDCQAGQTQLIVVASPALQAVPEQSPVARAFAQLARRHQLVYLRPWSAPVDAVFFRDSIHLNRDGSRRFSSLLAKELQGRLKE